MTLLEGKEYLRQKRFGVGLFHFGGEVGMKDHLWLSWDESIDQVRVGRVGVWKLAMRS
jgi:hypothetical protein